MQRRLVRVGCGAYVAELQRCLHCGLQLSNWLSDCNRCEVFVWDVQFEWSGVLQRLSRRQVRIYKQADVAELQWRLRGWVQLRAGVHKLHKLHLRCWEVERVRCGQLLVVPCGLLRECHRPNDVAVQRRVSVGVFV